MATSLLTSDSTFINLHDHIAYPDAGVLSIVIVKDAACQSSLFCLAAHTEISEHTATRNAIVHVVEGTGTLTLQGTTIPLTPGVLIWMPAHAPHALEAHSNLAFVLTLSALD